MTSHRSPRRSVPTLVIACGALAVATAAYLSLWPVPIEPRAWTAPPNPGYTGPFATNERLRGLELLDIGAERGPECVARDPSGRLYAGTHGGKIIRLEADGSKPVVFAETGGRPLGIAFAPSGDLMVADAFRGLLAVSPDGKVSLLTDRVGGTPVLYADDLDVARDGTVYFSDATMRFGARQWGGTLPASVLDVVEHGETGRLLSYQLATRETKVVATGFNFANGVAVSPDQTFVLMTETGAYRIWRITIAGPDAGKKEVILDGLPAFPDNVKAGRDGRFWVAFFSPRSAELDAVAGSPRLRKVMQRLPEALRPEPKPYGHVIAIDVQGRVLLDLQDPSGTFPMNTMVLETEEHLYLGSLVADGIGRLDKSRIGLR
jgi:sugar lactone lactonase YvrE